jgi:hypothetical protein
MSLELAITIALMVALVASPCLELCLTQLESIRLIFQIVLWWEIDGAILKLEPLRAVKHFLLTTAIQSGDLRPPIL